MPSAWITGARGFIGRHLSEHLNRRGFRVSGIGHGAWVEQEALAWGLSKWVNGDIHASNLQSLKAAVGSPDVVFHLAGGASVGAAIAAPHEDFFRTVVSTINLMDWIRLESPETVSVVASSAAVYGAGHVSHIVESDSTDPISLYGNHKLMMERICRSYAATFGLRVTVARLFSVYGNGLMKQLLWDLCSKLRSSGREPVKLGGTGAELRDWIHVRDAVHALTRLGDLAAPTAPIMNVATGVSTSIREIADLVLEAWPQDRRVVFTGEVRSGDPVSLVADCSRLSAVDYTAGIEVGAGVKEYVAWYLRYSAEVS
jgi:UDP-glucose 4-epimerase